MNNFFLLNTSLQLLTGYIIANTIHAEDHNYLLLLHPGGTDYWNKCFSLQKMSSDDSTWDQIIILENWLGRKSKLSISSLKQEINNMRSIFESIGTIDRVFLGADKNVQNQFLVELSGNSTYFRLEDGIWSYSSPDRQWASKISERIRIYLFRKIAGIKPIMEYNLSGLGRGKAASADYLYKPQLLERPSPKVITIQRNHIQKAMGKLVPTVNEYPELSGNSILFLGSIMVERHKVTLDQELDLLKKLSQLGNHYGMKLIFKPHPSESIEKLKTYREKLPEVFFIDVSDPIEFIYYTHSSLKIVMAHSSSGLLYADLFGKGHINTVALADLYGPEQIDPVLARILQKAGTYLPKSFAELTATFQI
jgi:Alpha-2,8-polysialyltransferase (POLYST)